MYDPNNTDFIIENNITIGQPVDIFGDIWISAVTERAQKYLKDNYNIMLPLGSRIRFEFDDTMNFIGAADDIFSIRHKGTYDGTYNKNKINNNKMDNKLFDEERERELEKEWAEIHKDVFFNNTPEPSPEPVVSEEDKIKKIIKDHIRLKEIDSYRNDGSIDSVRVELLWHENRHHEDEVIDFVDIDFN